MNRDEKEAAVKEISSELESAGAIFAVDYRGISVPQAAELRSKLRDSDASFSVVKNRLAKRAIDGTDTAAALDEPLVGRRRLLSSAATPSSPRRRSPTSSRPTTSSPTRAG